MTPPLDYDTFFVQQYSVRLLPLNMTILTVIIEAILVVELFRSGTGPTPTDLVLMGIGLVLLGIAALCRLFTERNWLYPLILITAIFGALASTTGAVIVYRANLGIAAMMPIAMMMVLVAAMVALRFWHVKVGWFVVILPVVWISSNHEPILPHQSEQMTLFIIIAVLLSSVMYFLMRRTKRSYYALYLRLDGQGRLDGMTQVLRNMVWREEAACTLSGTTAYRTALVLYVDIDHFKAANESGGHQRGDQVLVTLASMLRSGMGERGLVGRLGGDEFGVLMTSNAAEPDLIADARFRIEHISSLLRPVTFSVGGAVARPGESIDEVLARADMALFESKRTGRNRFTMDDEREASNTQEVRSITADHAGAEASPSTTETVSPAHAGQ